LASEEPRGDTARERLLELKRVVAGYHKKEVLRGLSLYVGRGEIVALLGPNGAGKTTTLKTITGFLRPSAGSVAYEGRDLNGTRPSDAVRKGIALVPQGGRVFAPLSVLENLELGAYLLPGHEEFERRLQDVYALFPRLRERQRRPAGLLSGGERQMLAISRALVLRPKLMLLDEPSEGLSPLLVREVIARLKEIQRTFGTTILLVEQNVRAALGISDRVYVMRLGEVVLEEDCPERLLDSERLRQAYIG
jgi:branched-chain amino acid transport system ATP-binding protein